MWSRFASPLPSLVALAVGLAAVAPDRSVAAESPPGVREAVVSSSGSGPGRAGAMGGPPAAAPSTRVALALAPTAPEALRLTGSLELAPAHRLVLPAVEALGVNLAIMGWNRWGGAAPWATISADSIGRNLRSRWVLDDDAFWVNQFGHPYQGTWAFTGARSAGLGFWESAPYSFAASALWEIAGETERPSINDQVTTTVAGVVLGEILTRFAGALRAEGGGVRVALASVLSPMGALNRRWMGPAETLEPSSSRWEASLGAASGVVRAGGDPSTAPWHGRAAFAFTWGLPGDPDLELDRPFDHFVLETGYGFASDPDATVRARGLVAGGGFEASPAVRGLYGLFLSFDFDTPSRYRVSTSALGFGASARAELGGGWALEGDAIGSAVVLGAAGAVDRAADGAGRDYRIGPGAQSLLDLTLLAGTRGRAGVAFRQYLVLGAGEPGGTELLLDGTASGAVRVAGVHGVGLEVSRRMRRASGGAGGPSREAGSIVLVSYVLFGGVPSS